MTAHERSRGTTVRLALALASPLILAACGLGDRAALEDRITAAPGRLEGTAVAGTITVEARLVSVPDAGIGGFGGGVATADSGTEIPDGGVAIDGDRAAFVVDLARSRAALTREGADRPYVLLDDLVFYGRRTGVPDDDARPWVRLDTTDLAAGSGELSPLTGRTVQAIAALHPAIVTDLAAGALTGSIETGETAEVAGVTATRYDVNIALDKAFGDTRRSRYPESRREAVEDIVELLGVDGLVHPAEIWLDETGRIRRLSISFEQRPRPRVEFALIVTLDFVDYDADFAPEVPTAREVLSVDSVVRFVNTVAPSPDDEPGGVPAVPPGLEGLGGLVPGGPDVPEPGAEEVT